MTVRTTFNKYAGSYDGLRQQLIPCFDEFYGAALSLLPFEREQHIDILDLGAGTGLLSGRILEHYPHAHIVLLDISENMLKQAQTRFAGVGAQVEFKLSDFCSEPLVGCYDAIVSALAIHHATADRKRELFLKIYDHLKPTGWFINADQVLGANEAIEARYRQHWLSRVRSAGVSESTLAEALERMREDRMSTLSDQLAWLTEAGFEDVNCWYQNYSFVVYSGVKR